jgi:uncharacterized membrane protein
MAQLVVLGVDNRDDKGKVRIHQAINLTGAGAPCWGPRSG